MLSFTKVEEEYGINIEAGVCFLFFEVSRIIVQYKKSGTYRYILQQSLTGETLSGLQQDEQRLYTYSYIAFPIAKNMSAHSPTLKSLGEPAFADPISSHWPLEKDCSVNTISISLSISCSNISLLWFTGLV